jgi:DNA-binding transcriptional ArsR family regulator
MSLSASFRALNRYSCCETLDILRKGPQSVSDIHAQVKVGTRANVSQALALLLEAEMVSMRRQGRNTIYQLRSASFKELIQYVEGLKRDALKRSGKQ